MKKLLSVILAAIMATSMCVASVIPAMAASVNSPVASTLQEGKVTITINGEVKQGVTYTTSATDSREVIFTFTGTGTLKGWENNLKELGLVEGTDFTIVENTDGTLAITFLTQKAVDSWNTGYVKVNAIVDEITEDTTAQTEETTEADEEETAEEATTTKSNASAKSPNTGVSTSAIAGSIALAGAGFAVLVATKKKDAE